MSLTGSGLRDAGGWQRVGKKGLAGGRAGCTQVAENTHGHEGSLHVACYDMTGAQRAMEMRLGWPVAPGTGEGW